MAVIGLSKPYYATYTNTSGTVTYGTLTNLAKACEMNIELDDADDVILHADNGPAERASGFTGGTLTLNIDELSITAAGAILGITPANSTSPAGTGNTITFGGNTAAPYLGFGIVVKKQVANAIKWMAVALKKVQFHMPNIEATTQGESIEFQTPELTATILRDDTTDANWSAWGMFDTEADAVSWLSEALPAGH